MANMADDMMIELEARRRIADTQRIVKRMADRRAITAEMLDMALDVGHELLDDWVPDRAEIGSIVLGAVVTSETADAERRADYVLAAA